MLGLPPQHRGSLIASVVFRRDQPIVAARPGDDFVIPPIEFVRFRALAVERCNRLFVLTR
jgi:hypothetical protein